MDKWIKVTIDGPSASGKSTVAKMLAAKIGFTHLDTGAIYRAIAFFYKKNNFVDADEEIQKNELEYFSFYSTGRGRYKRYFVNEEDVTHQIRSRDISELSSLISTKHYVRDFATKLQRTMSEGKNVVIEGRDTGSVVFPDADVKFYLDAEFEVRSKRRYLELKEKNPNISLSINEILKDLKNRDERDYNREISPLVCPKNAIKVDTTNLTQKEIVKCVESHIRKMGYRKKRKKHFLFSHKGKKCSFVYLLTKYICLFYFKIFHRYKVYGLENYEINTPAIIACNHVSFLDPPMMGCACPELVHGLARKTLFKSWLGSYWLGGVNTYPISGTLGDREMMKKVFSILLRGEKVIIFPEGTRSKDGLLKPLRRGLTLLADKGQAKVIPAAVVGSEKALPPNKKYPKLFVPLKVAFGKPIYYSRILKEIGDKKKAREIFLERVQDEIQSLIDKYKKF